MEVRRLYKAPTKPRVWDGETVFCIGKDADDSLISKISEMGRVVAGGRFFELLGLDHIDAYFFANRGDVMRNRKKVADAGDECLFFSIVADSRYYPNWKNFTRRTKGITFDEFRICMNGSEDAALINLAAILGAKRIILVGYDLHDDGDEKVSELISELARWTTHYELEVVVSDVDSTIEAFQYLPLNRILELEEDDFNEDLIDEDFEEEEEYPTEDGEDGDRGHTN